MLLYFHNTHSKWITAKCIHCFVLFYFILLRSVSKQIQPISAQPVSSVKVHKKFPKNCNFISIVFGGKCGRNVYNVISGRKKLYWKHDYGYLHILHRKTLKMSVEYVTAYMNTPWNSWLHKFHQICIHKNTRNMNKNNWITFYINCVSVYQIHVIFS